LLNAKALPLTLCRIAESRPYLKRFKIKRKSPDQQDGGAFGYTQFNNTGQ